MADGDCTCKPSVVFLFPTGRAVRAHGDREMSAASRSIMSVNKYIATFHITLRSPQLASGNVVNLNLDGGFIDINAPADETMDGDDCSATAA